MTKGLNLSGFMDAEIGSPLFCWENGIAPGFTAPTVEERIADWRRQVIGLLEDAPTADPSGCCSEELGQMLAKQLNASADIDFGSSGIFCLNEFFDYRSAAIVWGEFDAYKTLKLEWKRHREAIALMAGESTRPYEGVFEASDLLLYLPGWIKEEPDRALKTLLERLSQEFGIINDELSRRFQAVALAEVSPEMADPWRMLGLGPDASASEARSAFINGAKVADPHKFEKVLFAPNAGDIEALLQECPENLARILQLPISAVPDYLAEHTLAPWSSSQSPTLTQQALLALGFALLPSGNVISARQLFAVGCRERNPHFTESEIADGSLMPDVLRLFPLEDQDFARELLRDSALVARLRKREEDRRCFSLARGLQGLAHQQLLGLRQAWGQIRSGISDQALLQGVGWASSPQIHHSSKNPLSEEVRALATFKHWGGDLTMWQENGESELEAFRHMRETSPDSFYQVVPRDIDPALYGVEADPSEVLELEDSDVEIRRYTGGKLVNGKHEKKTYDNSHPPSLEFDFGKDVEHHIYDGPRRAINLKHLLVCAYKQQNKPLPAAVFNDLAQHYGWTDQQTQQVAQMINQGCDRTQIVEEVFGYVFPQYGEGFDRKDLRSLIDCQKSIAAYNECMAEIPDFEPELIPSLPDNAFTNLAEITAQGTCSPEEIALKAEEIRAELGLYYEKLEALYTLTVRPDGGWEITCPYLSKERWDDEDEGAYHHFIASKKMTKFTIEPGEVALIERIILDPDSVPKPHSPHHPVK